MSDLQTSFQGRQFLLKNLPTLPLALQEAMRLAESPQTTVAQLANVIGRDQALAGNVLKMVNSPFYGFPGRIGSIHNALALLGFNVVRNLIISTLIFENFLGNMTALWRHSLGCSLACGKLGTLLQVRDVDTLVLAGLLHDVGKVITASQLPEAMKRIIHLVREEDLTYQEAEKLILGIGHERIGDWLAEHWCLPPRLRNALACHHQPTSVQEYDTFTSIVHIGDFLTHLFEIGNSGDDHVPQLCPLAFRKLLLNRQKFSMALDSIGEEFEQEKVASGWQTSSTYSASAGTGMQKIPLNQAIAGMVLVYGVITEDGKVLAPAGSPVDDAMLRRLELAGVSRLVVQGRHAPGATMGYDAQARANRLDHLFRTYQDDKFMMTLKAGLHKFFTDRA